MSTDSEIATWVERAEMAERRALDAERECGYLRRELDALRASRLDPRAEERRMLVLALAADHHDRGLDTIRALRRAEAAVDAAIAAYDARAKETP